MLHNTVNETPPRLEMIRLKTLYDLQTKRKSSSLLLYRIAAIQCTIIIQRDGDIWYRVMDVMSYGSLQDSYTYSQQEVRTANVRQKKKKKKNLSFFHVRDSCNFLYMKLFQFKQVDLQTRVRYGRFKKFVKYSRGTWLIGIF